MDSRSNSDRPDASGPAERRPVNAYVDALDLNRPPELADFELETDPYRNFLPGVSNVNAARTIGSGLKEGRNGNLLLLLVSLLLVAVLILPAFVAVIAQMVR